MCVCVCVQVYIFLFLDYSFIVLFYGPLCEMKINFINLIKKQIPFILNL